MSFYRRHRYEHHSKLRGILTSSTVMPAEFRTRMVYVDPYNTSSSTGTPTAYQYRMNSLFDPNFTGVGHNPMGWDQIIPFYERYIVTGLKVTWPIHSDDNDLVVGLYADPVGTFLPGSMTEMMEDRQCYAKMLDNTKRYVISKYYAIHKILGITREQYEDDLSQNSATIITNPLSTPKLTFMSVAVDSGTYVFKSTIRLEFYCKFFQPRQFGLSTFAEAAAEAEAEEAADKPVVVPDTVPVVAPMPVVQKANPVPVPMPMVVRR